MSTNAVLLDVAAELEVAGVTEFRVLRERFDGEDFGNGEVILRIGNVIVRVVRDRGQDFLDLAFPSSPERYYQLDDVDIAMGWRTIDDVVARSEPESLHSAIMRLSQNLRELESAFSIEAEQSTRAHFDQAALARGRAFAARLRQRH